MNTTLTRRKKRYKINEISTATNVVMSILLTLLAIACILPLFLVISVSFTSAESIAMNGYRFIPDNFSLEAYKSVIEAGSSLFRSYGMTIFYAFGGTALSLLVMSMFAYVLAQKNFKARNFLAFFAFFTTLFSAGLVPSYIINTRVLHLNNTIWIFILPTLVSAFDVIILRTFIQTTIPDTLFEAAKLDGANDWTVYARIVMPLSKAGLATVGLFGLVTRWNEWFTGILYVSPDKSHLIPVMTYLQKILNQIDFLKNNSTLSATVEGQAMLRSLPTESVQMAISLLVALPLLVAYPFFQKYFVKGMTIGSVKG